MLLEMRPPIGSVSGLYVPDKFGVMAVRLRVLVKWKGQEKKLANTNGAGALTYCEADAIRGVPLCCTHEKVPPDFECTLSIKKAL